MFNSIISISIVSFIFLVTAFLGILLSLLLFDPSDMENTIQYATIANATITDVIINVNTNVTEDEV
jgi:hypothetical protein